MLKILILLNCVVPDILYEARLSSLKSARRFIERCNNIYLYSCNRFSHEQIMTSEVICLALYRAAQ